MQWPNACLEQYQKQLGYSDSDKSDFGRACIERKKESGVLWTTHLLLGLTIYSLICVHMSDETLHLQS